MLWYNCDIWYDTIFIFRTVSCQRPRAQFLKKKSSVVFYPKRANAPKYVEVHLSAHSHTPAMPVCAHVDMCTHRHALRSTEGFTSHVLSLTLDSERLKYKIKHTLGSCTPKKQFESENRMNKTLPSPAAHFLSAFLSEQQKAQAVTALILEAVRQSFLTCYL